MFSPHLNAHFYLWCLYLLCLLLIIISSDTGAETEKLPHAFPGGIVSLTINKHSKQLPIVRFGTKYPVIIDKENNWQILIGINVNTLPGEYLIYTKPADKRKPAFTNTFLVIQPNSVLAMRQINLDDLSHIELQHSSLSRLDFENTNAPKLPLIAPVKNHALTPFGSKVIISETNTIHTQNVLTYQIPTNSTVVAPGNAIVSKLELLDNGKSNVYLDHGRGLYSVIQSTGRINLNVNEGNGVVAGSVLAIMAESNVDKLTDSSPNLVWQVILNENAVNPEQLMTIR